MSREKCYAIYKGDKFIDLGTATELSNKLGIKVNSLKFHARPVYRRRVKNYDKAMIVIKIEED